MSSNNDNTMSRFLFAILQQKNLKDIDWNQVAHNPILTQEITNGHAARMRYSRFRQLMLGHDPKPRNRSQNKSKVTKSKKDPKAKKKDGQIKPDPIPPHEANQQGPAAESHHVKNEISVKAEPCHIDARLTPVDLPPNTSMADAQMQFQNRLLTPCSDTDVLAPTHHGFATSPASDLHHDQLFSYAAAAAHCVGHDPNTWQSSPSPFSPFGIPTSYDMDVYPASPFGGQHHPLHQQNFGVSPSDTMVADASRAPVKHEEWDSQYPS